MSADSRHENDGTQIEDFLDRVLVRCPRCNQCADVLPDPQGRKYWDARLSCLHCGHTRRGSRVAWLRDQPTDWFFGLPLWLQIDCCGHTLWAFNFDHLQFLKSYIAAKHRLPISQQQALESGTRNKTLASSLPGWMISARHRSDVLHCIDKLVALDLGGRSS